MRQKIKNDAESAELKNQLHLNINGPEVQEEIRNIPPWKLAILFKLAEKFMNQLANQPTWLISNYEVEFILQTMLDTVRRARGTGDGKDV